MTDLKGNQVPLTVSENSWTVPAAVSSLRYWTPQATVLNISEREGLQYTSKSEDLPHGCDFSLLSG